LTVLSAAADVVKYSLIPGSLSFLLFALSTGAVLLWVPRLRGVGRAWLTFVAIAYLVLATPAGAVAVARVLGPDPPRIRSAVDARRADAIVVLGAGAVTWGHGDLALHELSRRSIVNALEGARLYRMLGDVPVIVSGGIVNSGSLERSEADLLADALAELGVPRARIAVERTSVNTYEQSVRVAPMLTGHERFVLVTTPVHLRRAMALFEARGLHPVPGPSDPGMLRDPDTSDRSLIPNLSALRESELTLYEALAVRNARARGWLARSDTVP
jgi:uncharacterized SAM-binding protein YcdF (DUF218 family)